MKKLTNLFDLLIYFTTYRIFDVLGKEEFYGRVMILVVLLFIPLFLIISNNIKYFSKFLGLKIFFLIVISFIVLINFVNLDELANWNSYLILSSVYTVIMMVSVIYFIKKEAKKSNQNISERFLYLYSSLFLILQLILILGKHFNLALNNDFISLGFAFLVGFIAMGLSNHIVIDKTEKKEIQESN